MYMLVIYATVDLDGAIFTGVCRVPEDPRSRLTLDAAMEAAERWATRQPDDIVMLVPMY